MRFRASAEEDDDTLTPDGCFLAAACYISTTMGQYWTEVAVRGVVIDPLTGDPAILLADDNATAVITAPADPGGAEAIICELEGIHREATHTLLYRFFVRHGVRVSRLEIGQDSSGNLSSALCYRHDGHSYQMDMRPADGISMAIQSSAPMFASAELIHESSRSVSSPRVLENRDLLLLSATSNSRFPSR